MTRTRRMERMTRQLWRNCRWRRRSKSPQEKDEQSSNWNDFKKRRVHYSAWVSVKVRPQGSSQASRPFMAFSRGSYASDRHCPGQDACKYDSPRRFDHVKYDASPPTRSESEIRGRKSYSDLGGPSQSRLIPKMLLVNRYSSTLASRPCRRFRKRWQSTFTCSSGLSPRLTLRLRHCLQRYDSRSSNESA